MIDPNESALAAWDRRTAAFLSSQGWQPGRSALLLAVSGGADSTALLLWARRHASRTGARIAAAHVNHKLRPDADADQAFVVALCRGLGFPCVQRTLDPASRRPRESVEMWARRERYAFFDQAAESEGAEWILTAHHRDDLVETIFQRLGRGTGPRGLRGIPFRRGRIVRPFLDRSRAEILAYLGRCGAAWREDESNADIRIDRNWYRHRYLPSLRAEEPELDARIFAMAMRVQAIGKGCDVLEEAAALLQTDSEGNPYLALRGVAERVTEDDSESLDFWIRRLLRAAAQGSAAVSGGGGESASRPLPVTKEILREFRRQWKTGPRGLRVPLSGTLALKCGNNGVYCVESALDGAAARGRAKKSCSPPDQRVILIEGSAEASWRWGDRIYALSARRYPKPPGLVFPASGEERAIFDAAVFSCTLVIRTRKDGDRFSPHGVRSLSRKLKTFFNEEKVPVGTRDGFPLVLSGETVAWVPGLGISDFFKVSGSTSHILELVLKCENP